MSNRQARIKRLKAAFQKAEELMNEGCIVQWYGEVVTRFDWSSGLEIYHGDCFASSIYDDVGEFQDLADSTIAEINSELKERLTVWKQVEVRL